MFEEKKIVFHMHPRQVNSQKPSLPAQKGLKGKKMKKIKGGKKKKDCIVWTSLHTASAPTNRSDLLI